VNGVGSLKSQRGADRIGRLGEFSNKGIASDLTSDPSMAIDGFRKLSKRLLNALVSERLVQLHQPRGTDHIGVQDDHELTCWLISHDEGLFILIQEQLPLIVS